MLCGNVLVNCMPRHLQLAGARGRLQDQGVVTHHPVVLHPPPQAKPGPCSGNTMKKRENKTHVFTWNTLFSWFWVLWSLEKTQWWHIYLCLPALPACLPVCLAEYLFALMYLVCMYICEGLTYVFIYTCYVPIYIYNVYHAFKSFCLWHILGNCQIPEGGCLLTQTRCLSMGAHPPFGGKAIWFMFIRYTLLHMVAMCPLSTHRMLYICPYWLSLSLSMCTYVLYIHNVRMYTII